MAKKSPAAATPRSSSSPSRKKPAADPQVQFLVMSLTNLVVEMVEAKCQSLSKRERGTLERRILKAVQMFAGARRES